MIIIRKYFSDSEEIKENNPEYSKEDYKRIGEALGTVGVGAAGMYGASGLTDKVSNLLIQNKRKKATSAYRDYLKKESKNKDSYIKKLADVVRSKNLEAAEEYSNAVNRHNKSFFGKMGLVRDAEENMKRVNSDNKIWFNKSKNAAELKYKNAVNKFKKDLISGRDKDISKISKRAKGTKLGILAAGTALTGLSAASLLRNKNKKNKEE